MAMAPSSISLPLRFMVTGLASLLIALVWLVIQPEILASYHYSPTTVAATHLLVLGWILTTVMGAMYQLVPIALETRLYSERLARWQFLIHVIGFVGMVWMFRNWNLKLVGHYGSAMALGMGLFVYNLVRTLMRVKKWNTVAISIATALFWILFTAIVGLSIAAGKCEYDSAARLPSTSMVGALVHFVQQIGLFMARFAPLGAMHAHAHLGVVGFFLALMIGISYKLIPMFTLSEIQNHRRAAWSIGLLNAGLAGAFLSILLQNRWKLAFAAVLMAALLLYGLEMRAILRRRKRGPLDWGVRSFLTAMGLLGPISVVGLVLAWPSLPWSDFNGQLENLYGFLALIGVMTFGILGMLHKIIPFLIWFGVYSRQVGRARVPALSDMYSARLQATGYWIFLAGLALASGGILARHELLARCGGFFLLASLGTTLVNLAFILSHAWRPKLLPLQTDITPAKKR